MRKHFILLLLLVSSFLASQQKKHVVEAKETLYGLSKKYNVTIDDLKKANPQLNQRTPQIGETLIIPDKTTIVAPTPTVPDNSSVKKEVKVEVETKAEPEKTIPAEDSEYIYVTIEPKQTLYGLSKKYKTSVESIKKLNPKMDEKGPKIGEVIKISNNSKSEKEKKNKKNQQTTLPIQPPLVVDSTELINKPDYSKDALNIVFLLPFHIGESKVNAERNIATEFYSGAKLALDSLSNKGKKLNITILDSGNENKFKETINTFDFSNTHLIIGPLFKSSILMVADKISNIPIVSPFSSSDELDDHENVILYNTKDQTLAEKLASEMLKKYSGEKTYILYDDDGDHYKTALYFQSLISNKKNAGEIILTKNADDIKLEQNLVTEEYNKIYAILISDQDSVINKYLEIITKFETNQIQPISLFYSSLFDNKKYVEKLLNFGLIYSDTNYVNEYGFNEQKTLKFYKQKFCSIPGKYAVAGFDVTYDILSRINDKGNLSTNIMKVEGKQLSNKYSFSRIKKNGAWANQGARIIQLLK